jgi:uroporphyrinogen decarboxylase
MKSRERVLTAFARREPDRVPVDYSANPGIDRRLKEHFGLGAGDDEGLRRALGVDFRGIGAGYTGPKLHADVPGRTVDEWGIHRRWIEHGTGGYWDFCDFPLLGAGDDAIANWPVPSADHHDYSSIPGECSRHEDYCLFAGSSGAGDIINKTGMVRTMEQTLVDLIEGNEAVLRYIDRRLNVQLEVLERTLQAARGRIDFLWIGEDLGSRMGPLISPDLFRRHLRPRLQRFVDLARRWRIPVMIHSCGSSCWAFGDFLEMGITAVDTLQPEAKDMSPASLKKRFGERLAFHGCISTGGPVAFGSAGDVVENVRETLEIMMPGGGYALSPAHQLQDNSPTENVLAMYDAARKFGVYRKS